MKKTNIYGFGYLEPGDLTSELLDMDLRRFLAIENNVQHLFSIFGNGIIVETGANSTSSWEIRPPTNNQTLQIYITPGEGHIAWCYCSTSQNVDVKLPLSSGVFPAKFWIYATRNSTSPELGTVDFIASLVEINNPNYYVGLGAVTVSVDSNGNYAYAISNEATDGRVVINLFNTLASRVNAHKHIGGTRNPSPIDLSAHVQGKLSGDYISDLDASKITKGVISAERLPQIDHNKLSRRGTLSHSEIDSLLADLTYPTGSRLSDLFISNMLQLTLALKKQTGLSQIDKNLINVIMYQPGYNEDDSFVSYYSDWASTTDLTSVDSEVYVPDSLALATIDKTTHRIIGGNPSQISSDNVFWKTDTDFLTAFDQTKNLLNEKSTHIEILGEDDPAYFKLLKPYRFKNLSGPELYPGQFPTSRGWTIAINTAFNPGSTILYETSTYIFKYFKDVNNNNITYDFSNLSKLGISYSITEGDKDVYLYLILSSGGTSITFDKTNNVKSIQKSTEVLLYDANESKTEEDLKSFDIDSFIATLTTQQKQSIVGFGFRWLEDNELRVELKDADLNSSSLKLTSDEFKRAQVARIYGVDEEEISPSPDSAVFVWNEKFYYNTGQLVIRFNDSSGTAQFSSVSEVVDDTSLVRIFTRVAASEASLNLAPFYEVNADYTISSSNTTGNWIDIKILLTASSDLLTSPEVDSIGLYYIRAGESGDKLWDTVTQFQNQGLKFTNIGVVTNTSPFGTGFELTGTLTFTAESTAVTGSGTLFIGELTVGERLYYSTGTYLGTVLTITSNTVLVLEDGATTTYTGNVFRNDGDTDFLQISNTSDVGNYQFLRFNSEGHSSYIKALTEENDIYTGMVADPYLGGLYTTPYQAFNKTALNGLEKARDVFILPNKNLVIADTQNDRVVEVDTGGTFVRAIQGNVRLKRNVRDFVALTAYYNKNLSTLYICFSQYFTLGSGYQTKINIQSADQIISFDNTGRSTSDYVEVSYFKQVTWATGAGNGANIPTTAKFQGPKTATMQVKFKGATLEQLNSWQETDIYVNIYEGAVTWNGNDGIAYPTSNTGSQTNYGSELPDYLDSPKKLYNNVGGTGEFKSSEFVSYKGLIQDEITFLNGDFNLDNVLPEGTTTVNTNLMGLDGEMPARLKVFVGNVVMDNLFSPVSVQAIEESQWVVAACGEYSISRYDVYGSNIERYRIPYTTVKFIEGKGGSAYLAKNGTNLYNRNLIIAAPAQTATDGRFMIINQKSNQTTSTNTISFTKNFTGLDAVRAIQDLDELHYWIALDDVALGGISSKVVKIDTAGNIKLEWGSGLQDLIHPVGLAYTNNGDLLISE